MFLVVVGLGWAALRVYQTLREPALKPVPLMVATPPAPADRQVLNVQEVFKLHDLGDIRDRWLGLADQFKSGVPELRAALENYVRSKDRTAIARYLQKGQALQTWLERQEETFDHRKAQDLAEWLRSQPGPSLEVTTPIRLDFDKSLRAGGLMLSNLLITIRINEGQPLTPELVQKRLSSATVPEQALLALADEARNQATSIDAYVTQRSGELARTNAPEQALPQVALVEAPPAVDSEKARSLQFLFYALIVALVIQCVLLGVTVYRRVVVTPLHERLVETNTAARHQRKLDHFARLATGLAHEIRNPLTAISVRLFTLQKSLAAGTPQHSDATLIRNEIDRLDQIVKNFLKLARPTDSRLGLMRPLSLLKEVRELLGPQLQQQEITLQCEDGVDEPFQGDPAQLKQVLINLVQNAADSIGRDGSVILRARAGEARFKERKAPAVILEVEDNGSGIAPEVQDRLFDPFFSTKEDGTGLGLPIAARIIDQHHGRLDFESQPGRGTIFRVMLPAVSEQKLNA